MRIWELARQQKVQNGTCDVCHNHPIYKVIERHHTHGKTNRPWHLCYGCLMANKHLLFNSSVSMLTHKVNQMRKAKDKWATPLQDDGTYAQDHSVALSLPRLKQKGIGDNGNEKTESVFEKLF